ncbi:hypothetical protein F4860DRAFT_499004 [Xylaria cubensis]|nr:hypothetical protein F4860DRAFT_499004 [Xylaria cubensis]
MSWTGAEYSEPYGKAEITIGCGVNFDANIAFYTRNGAVIGMSLLGPQQTNNLLRRKTD